MNKGYLVLEDGKVFPGEWLGGQSQGGEVVFNTAHNGYEEIATDPSYFGQIMTTTTAHIGNYGTATEEVESDSVKISGLVCKKFSDVFSRDAADTSLQEYFEAHKIVAISDIDKKRRSLSIDSYASTAEYDLIYSVRYKLTHSPTQTLISNQVVEASQSYRHQSSALIAKEREQGEIKTKLNQKITNIIFRQLSVFDAQRIQQTINAK